MRRKSQSGIQIEWNSEMMNFGQIHCKVATIILFFFLYPHSFKCDFEVPSVKGIICFPTPSIWAELVTYFQQQNAATVTLYMYTCALHTAALSLRTLPSHHVNKRTLALKMGNPMEQRPVIPTEAILDQPISWGLSGPADYRYMSELLETRPHLQLRNLWVK